MRYDISKLPLQSLLKPLADAGAALVRLDERIAQSPVGQGWRERMQFTDACASLWIDGGLVYLEDLVLHDAGSDIHAPTHDLTIARDVLVARRRIAAQPADWALSAEGLRSLRGAADFGELAGQGGDEASIAQAPVVGETMKDDEDGLDPLADVFAAIDVALARSDAALSGVTTPRRGPILERDPRVYDLDWDEEERLSDWRATVDDLDGLPPLLQAIVALDAWTRVSVLQHRAWLGRLLAAACLRQAGVTTATHLAAINLGLKSVPLDRRRHRDRDTRLLGFLSGLHAAADLGLKAHDRLTLARQAMQHRLIGRRTSSKLPQLVDLVLARPVLTAGMAAEALDVTPQAALRIIGELNLREMTGRGRYRAWGIL